ncbi:MAG: DNA polymerase III subunit gamma/tau [Planctomycetes bacterium]|nr:DNA polymerase III subunit gamma/tau [Planctomycetota bacterium]
MANSKSSSSPLSPEKSTTRRQAEYVVVARRYRPRSFEELVGQAQAAQAMRNAIITGRVGHAYLFTGARGVGKTSTARIFAKALNCETGPTPTPCNECDICLSIAAGEDVDVLEIDGASNRGIDEIRQLRSNVNVRPSRARFKIYIIDEVHMLTTQAYNALLKTLEEPPEHVKFIFCTTDPEKIPITVLSRCQRFDFAPVKAGAIVERLQHIVDSEGVKAEPEALQLLARRAAGSMRDSQSLLEQLLSFCGDTIAADDVHAMLGTARGGALDKLASHILARDAAAALAEVEHALSEGVDAGQLAEQLLGYFRDMMAAAVGCGEELMLNTLSSDYPKLSAAAGEMGLETILAVVQILDQTVVRMRQSAHGRVLLEMAVVRTCSLENLDELAALTAELKDGAAPTTAKPSGGRARPTPTAAPEKKSAGGNGHTTPERIADPPASVEPETPREAALTPENAEEIWRQVVESLSGLTKTFAETAAAVVAPSPIATSAPNRLALIFPENYNFQKQQCERPEHKQKIEQALAEIIGAPIALTLEASAPAREETQAPPPRRVSRQQRLVELRSHPLVSEAIREFDAEILRAE